MIIRHEQPGDETAIYELTLKAFEPMRFSSGTEAPIINQLRKDGDLTLSLVALIDDEIIGHITFSPVTINGEENGWIGLGPVSVRPDLQKQGIGHKLITEGLAIVKARGSVGCVLTGNPNYYSRFGFKNETELTYGDTPSKYVQWLPFGDAEAKGELKFANAFEGGLEVSR